MKDGVFIKGRTRRLQGQWRLSAGKVFVDDPGLEGKLRRDEIDLGFRPGGDRRELSGVSKSGLTYWGTRTHQDPAEAETEKQKVMPTGKTSAREQEESRAREERERLAREQKESKAREERERVQRENAERLSREHQERMARAEQERVQREQAAKQADERVNGMSEENFLKRAKEMENGTRPAAAKPPAAKEMRSFNASIMARSREGALASLHREHNYRRQQDPTVTELTNIRVESKVFKGPSIVEPQGGRLKTVKEGRERVDWFASGEYRMQVSKPQSATRQ